MLNFVFVHSICVCVVVRVRICLNRGQQSSLVYLRKRLIQKADVKSRLITLVSYCNKATFKLFQNNYAQKYVTYDEFNCVKKTIE